MDIEDGAGEVSCVILCDLDLHHVALVGFQADRRSRCDIVDLSVPVSRGLVAATPDDSDSFVSLSEHERPPAPAHRYKKFKTYF